MDNPIYQVRRDYLDGNDVLDSLSPADKRKVEAAIADLAKNRVHKTYRLTQIDDHSFKFTVPVKDDEICLIYEVNYTDHIIDLAKIKRSSFRKALKYLAGLLDFSPSSKPPHSE
jgi:hypothetical protein